MTTSTSTSSSAATADVDSFTQELQHSQQLDARAYQIRQEQLASLAKLRTRLVERVKLYRELFEDRPAVDPEGDGERVRDIATNDYLHSWEVLGENFRADMRYGFRGELNYYEILLPLRYLQADGEAHIRADAAAWVQQQEAEAEAERQRRVAEERATLRELQAKYPDAPADDNQS